MDKRKRNCLFISYQQFLELVSGKEITVDISTQRSLLKYLSLLDQPNLIKVRMVLDTESNIYCLHWDGERHALYFFTILQNCVSVLYHQSTAEIQQIPYLFPGTIRVFVDSRRKQRC